MFSVNKNIIHNGKSYVAGSEIKPSDAGFKDLQKAGHLNSKNESIISKEIEIAPIPEAVVEEIVKSPRIEIFKKAKKKKG